MQGNYRKIQPAPRDDADEIDRKFRVAKRKRQHVRIACNPCREKKRACNGVEPTCDQCAQAFAEAEIAGGCEWGFCVVAGECTYQDTTVESQDGAGYTADYEFKGRV
ncbi:hypothetical protein NW756_000225 [Fusarium oxysporum]|nr:hypothetical protein NW756_000225 [Fusarium oxysporum]